MSRTKRKTKYRKHKEKSSFAKVRKPIPKAGQIFKSKKDYIRKKKHSTNLEDY